MRFAIFLVAGVFSALMQQAADPATEAARTQDVYAVYSVLMSNPRVIGGDSKTYAIAASTTPASLDRAEGRIGRCGAPPPGNEKRWEEILADFRSRTDSPVSLQRELKIAKPYVFLTEAEIEAFMSAQNANRAVISAFDQGASSAHITYRGPAVPDPQFGGAVSVFSLSNVYFNSDRTLAVVSISSACGGLCGQGQRIVYEKIAGSWRVVTGGISCEQYS
jgi:hypothetical protein